MTAITGTMSPELAVAIQDFIHQQTGKTVTLTSLDYSFFNDRIHFLVNGGGNYRINIVKGTISRPNGIAYSRVPRCNTIESGAADLEVIKSLLIPMV